MFDINYTTQWLMQSLFTMFQAFLYVYLCIKFFKLNLLSVSPLILLLTIEQLCFQYDYIVFISLLTMCFYLYSILKIKNLYSLLVPLLSLTIYMICLTIQEMLTPHSILIYSNMYETIIIYLIFLYFINQFFNFSKKNFHIETTIHFIMAFIVIIFLLSFLIKLLYYKTYSHIEIILLSISLVMLSFFFIYLFFIYDKTISSNKELQNNLKKAKFLTLNTVQIKNNYNLNNKLNHNMKYILMNIKLYLNNNDISSAIEYINEYLNKMSTNQICYTNNPQFDYIINEHSEILKKDHLNVEKEIIINENSFINNDIYIQEIKDFLNKQVEYLNLFHLNEYHLNICEKGDFVVLKAFYQIDLNDIHIKDYQHNITDHLLTIKHILYN